MKKFILFFCTILALSYGMHALFSFQEPSPPSTQKQAVSESRKTPYQIAIITPLTHPSLEQIQKGFIETLTDKHPELYSFKVYNAQGNKTLMRSEIEDIASKHYDLIFAIGMQATKMSKEVLTKKKQLIPIVFGAVPKVAQHTLELSSGDFTPMTGTSEVTDFRTQLELITYLKKDVQKVLLVYDPSLAGLETDRENVETIAEQKGLKIIPVQVFKTNEIRQKVLPFMDQVDVVLVLKDNTVVSGLDTLAKLCEAHQVLLCASDLDSPDKGAAIGFGVYEYDYGAEAAKMASEILRQELSPLAIPIQSIDQFKLKINPSNLKKQGLELAPELLFLIQNGESL
jgi:putative ABC transport system substrate-binding protein